MGFSIGLSQDQWSIRVWFPNDWIFHLTKVISYKLLKITSLNITFFCIHKPIPGGAASQRPHEAAGDRANWVPGTMDGAGNADIYMILDVCSTAK